MWIDEDNYHRSNCLPFNFLFHPIYPRSRILKNWDILKWNNDDCDKEIYSHQQHTKVTREISVWVKVITIIILEKRNLARISSILSIKMRHGYGKYGVT